MAWADGYAGNFSPLHAGELAFNTRLSLQLRQDAARRMLQYPETVANRPLLRFALENMADGSPLSLACYEAVLPLGIVHNAILRNADHWNVVYYLWKHPIRTSSPISPRSGQPLDWPKLHRQADALYRAHSNNNEFGLDNEQWDRELRQEMVRQKNTRSKESFLRTLQVNQEWVDLELLLRELTELGARPLLLSMPLHGGWYDQLGITYAARSTTTKNYARPVPAITLRLSISPITTPISPSATTTWGTWLPVDWCITARSSTVSSTIRSPASPNSSPLHPCRAEGPELVSRPGWLPGPDHHPPSVSTNRPPRRR